jgi:hypothetical protein
MSFFGGGTDIPEFFNEEGGSVISTTFDKYCYVTLRRLPGFFDYSTELSYSRVERVTDIKKISHPAIKNCMEMLNIDNIRLAYEADLPARSGLGTSSSFAVGMLNAFHALRGEYSSKKQLSEESIYLERVLCNEAGGWQDQIAAAYGGFNRIDFKNNSFTVKPIIIPSERKNKLNQNLLLFFTGFTRFSSEIQKINGQDNTKSKKEKLRMMKQIVDDAEKILIDSNSDINDFGRLLDKSWRLKRQTGSAITTDGIDTLYERGINSGALGGKLLGAGGGGFLLFYVPQEAQQAVRKELKDLLYIPFNFEDDGSVIIYYNEDKGV